MRYECKKCGKNMTERVIQQMINDLILSGRKYIHSDGTEAKYKKIEMCKC